MKTLYDRPYDTPQSNNRDIEAYGVRQFFEIFEVGTGNVLIS